MNTRVTVRMSRNMFYNLSKDNSNVSRNIRSILQVYLRNKEIELRHAGAKGKAMTKQIEREEQK